MRLELASVDSVSWYNALNSNRQQMVTMCVYTTLGLNNYEVTIPIYADVLPETYTMLLKEAYSKSTDDRNSILEILNNIDNYENAYMDVYITVNSYENDYATTFNGSNEKVLVDFLLNNISDNEITADCSYALVTMYTYGGSTKKDTYTALFNLDDLTLSDINSVNLDVYRRMLIN
jgi:hypothetical protein